MEKTSSTGALSSGRPLSAAAGVLVAAFMATTIVLTPLPAAAVRGKYLCALENHMPKPIYLECDDMNLSMFSFGDEEGVTLYPGDIGDNYYHSKSEPKEKDQSEGYTGKATCLLTYAGNKMSGVVKWDETWPEAESCYRYGRPGCKIVFENEVVTLVSGTGGRRVLGDLAVKDCSKNNGGWGGWLSSAFGLGCTYPKHDHPYVGTVVS